MRILKVFIVAIGIFGTTISIASQKQYPHYWWSTAETDGLCEFQATVYMAKGLDPLLKVTLGERESVILLVPETPTQPSCKRYHSADSDQPLPLGYPTFDLEIKGTGFPVHGEAGTIDMALSGRQVSCTLIFKR